MFGIGIAIGAFMAFPSGALLVILYGDLRIARLTSERDGAVSRATRETTRARNLHRRAQKAEGRLERIDRILLEEDAE